MAHVKARAPGGVDEDVVRAAEDAILVERMKVMTGGVTVISPDE
jgi:hypothetical protein